MARAPAAQQVEALPEADRLGDFPHPRDTARLFGLEAGEAMLAEALAEGRTHHAWLLSGPQGIGKATLAYRFARAALASPDERDPSGTSLSVPENSIAARQVRALSHPGLLLIRRPYDTKAKRFTTSIPVDEVRRLRSFLSHRAAGDGWRVVIVDQADDLNVNAANALLKSLEEPPERTVFLLISSAPGQLVPTIRSRCRDLVLPALSDKDLRAAAEQALAVAELKAPDQSEWSALIALAGGSTGRLLGLLGGGGIELQGHVDRLIETLPRVDWNAVHRLGDELQPTAANERFELFYELLLETLARLIRVAVTGEGTDAERQRASRIMGEARLASFAGLWERIAREKAQTVGLNLDRKGLILDTAANLAAAAQDTRSA